MVDDLSRYIVEIHRVECQFDKVLWNPFMVECCGILWDDL